MRPIDEMPREELLRLIDAYATTWLAHAGCWFLAAAEELGDARALEMEGAAWERSAAVEARALMGVLGARAGGGLDALERVLQLRMAARVNLQRTERTPAGRLRLYVDECRMQQARRRRGVPDFPCATAGASELSTLAHTVDPLIATTCLSCPPGEAEGPFCAWEFSLPGDLEGDRATS